MNAQDLKEITNTITNTEKLDVVYNEILLPMLKFQAERKQSELSIGDNQNHQSSDKLEKLGFKGNLQYLCRQEMLPYLFSKGFTVSHSPYSTRIKW